MIGHLPADERAGNSTHPFAPFGGPPLGRRAGTVATMIGHIAWPVDCDLAALN